MLKSEVELQHTVTALARMYDLCKRLAVQEIGEPSTIADEIEGTQAMIRKLERELAEYLAKKYAEALHPQEDPKPRDGQDQRERAA